MIIEIVQKMKCEVDEDLYEMLSEDEVEEAIKDGRLKYISIEQIIYKDGELDESESDYISKDEIDELVEDMKKAD